MSTLLLRSTPTISPFFSTIFNRKITAELINKSSSKTFSVGSKYSQYKRITMYNGNDITIVPKNNINSRLLLGSTKQYGLRSYSEKASSGSGSGSNSPTQSSSSSPSKPSPSPSPPKIPERAQVERAFFRVVAFFWDYGFWLFAWSRKMIKMHVVEKPIVKLYWKRFQEKMEEAKKDA